jgi:hypothetical protein
VPTTSEPDVRDRIIPMLSGTSYATSSKNVRYRIRCRTSKWQETGKNVRHRTFFSDIVCCTYDVVQKTYDVVYDIVYNIARTIGKKRVKTYDIVRFFADIVCCTYDVVRTNIRCRIRHRTYYKKHTTSYTTWYIRHRIRYMYEQRLFRSHHHS